MAYIETLFSEHFIQYASYVIRDRAIPALADGLKPVQRRILQSLWDMDDGKFHKVANVVGHCMQYHPHGDASIYAALVNLANKELFIEKQGNFGNIYTGDPASAARYIECRLSPLARRTLFHPEITEFLPSYDGRRNEPVALPAKLPYLLILGAEGIAVGMSTRILPHNFGEVIAAMQAYLRGQEFSLLPDFATGGLLDASQYNCGQGKVLSRARLDCQEKQIVIRELPYGVTADTLIASLEAAARKGRIRLQEIQNFTAEEVEIVLQMPRNTSASEQIEALYAFTDCEVSISCNLLAIDDKGDKRPLETDVDTALRYGCQRLKNILQAELELEARQLRQQLYGRKLEQIFIEQRLYQRLEALTGLKAIEADILSALQPYCTEDGELGRPPSKDELSTLLRIPIRRISQYDLARTQKELRELEKRLRQVLRHLKDLNQYALRYLQELAQEFGPVYPRKSQLVRFAKTDVRQAARRDQLLRYDAAEGFLGYGLKSGEALLACSHYDRVLLLRSSGSYSVLDAPEKLFVGKDLILCHLAGKEELAKLECAVFYRSEKHYAYAKRFAFGGYILGKEYHIFPPEMELLHFSASIPNSQHTAESPDRPAQVAQDAACAAAFVVQFQASQRKPSERRERWHYRWADLPTKAAKARGQLLRRQRVSSVKAVSQARLNKLLLSGGAAQVLAPDFPPVGPLAGKKADASAASPQAAEPPGEDLF